MTCKLIDFEKKRNQLEISSNPFAAVIELHLDALAAKKQPQEERLITKISLTKRLYDKGFQKAEIINIFRFLDFSIALNEPFELQYQEEIHKIGENNDMNYILSPLERLTMKQGLKKGMEKGIEKVALELLKIGRPEDEIIKVTKLTKEQFQKIREKLLH
jgi:hypothetical protein